MKKSLTVFMVFSAFMLVLTQCQKEDKGFLTGLSYSGNSPLYVTVDGGDPIPSTMTYSFKTATECEIKFVSSKGGSTLRYNGTYTVATPSEDGSREVSIDVNMAKYNVDAIDGFVSKDRSTFIVTQGKFKGTFNRQ